MNSAGSLPTSDAAAGLRNVFHPLSGARTLLNAKKYDGCVFFTSFNERIFLCHSLRTHNDKNDYKFSSSGNFKLTSIL